MAEEKKKKWYNFMKTQLMGDILKENGVYSQGRIYLLLSIVAYYVTLGYLTYSGSKKNHDVDLTTFKDIIDALQWSMGLFAGYVFGGKGLEALKVIMTKGTGGTVPPPVDGQ